MIHDFSTARSGRGTTDSQGAAVLLDDIEAVSDFSPATLELLSYRIAQSCGYEQLVYREVELDEAWRLLDSSIADARRTGAQTDEITRLEQLRDGVVEAHDMLSDPAATQRAAARLRSVLG